MMAGGMLTNGKKEVGEASWRGSESSFHKNIMRERKQSK